MFFASFWRLFFLPSWSRSGRAFASIFASLAEGDHADSIVKTNRKSTFSGFGLSRVFLRKLAFEHRFPYIFLLEISDLLERVAGLRWGCFWTRFYAFGGPFWLQKPSGEASGRCPEKT